MDKGHIKAVSREEIKMVNTYMEKFTQVEISSMLGINTSKVSKLIRKGFD